MWLYLLLIVGLLIFYKWKKHMEKFQKWSHLPQPEKPHWYWGNKPLFSKGPADTYLDFYNALKGHRYGVFWSGTYPSILVRDLDLIKKIMVTDGLEHFTDFGFKPYEENPKNSFGLADLRGESWRKLKRALTGSFSTPRLKKNIHHMNESALKLVGYLHSIENNEFVEAKKFSGKYYLSCLATIGFGLNVDCFGEKKSTFEEKAGNLFSLQDFLLIEFWPGLANLLGKTGINPGFEKYIANICKSVVKARKDQNLQYNDMLNNLIEVSKEHPEMTEEIMYKTCIQFFSDGYETAGMVFGILAYYLAVYPEVQTRLQDEIDELMDGKDEDEELTQEDITNMTYLEQVLLESERLSPLPNTGRICTKDWKVPGDDHVIKKTDRVLIPVIGLHMDPEYWPEPRKFDPERFSSENKKNIEPITFMTFGSGPRQCLGMNVYNVQTKVLLVHLLRNFSLKPYGDMPKEMVWDKFAFIGKDKYEMKLERRDH